MWDSLNQTIIHLGLMPAMLTYCLVLCRMSGLFLLAPLFGSGTVPVKVKVAILVMLSVCLVPLVPAPEAQVFRWSGKVAGLAVVCAGEIGVGLIFGMAVHLFFAAVQFAGQVLGQQVGFAMANMMDPVSSVRVSVFGQLYYMMAVGVFLAANLHMEMIGVIRRSFHLVPLGCSLQWPQVCSVLTVGIGGTMWRFGLQVALPGMLGVFLVTVGLGFLARSIPEINIYIIGFGLQALVGIWLLYLGIPLMVDLFRDGLGSFMREGAGLLTWGKSG